MNNYPTTKNLRDRVVVENGIPTIRPLRNGKPGPTPAEADAAIAKCEAAFAAYHASRGKPPFSTVDEFQRQLNERARNWERAHKRYVEENL